MVVAVVVILVLFYAVRWLGCWWVGGSWVFAFGELEACIGDVGEVG